MRSEVKKTDSLSDEGITFNVEDDLGSGFFFGFLKRISLFTTKIR